MNAFRIFTISDGLSTEGARVDKYKIKGAGVEIPAVIVGEDGPGRGLGIVPVENQDGELVRFAEIGETRMGKKPKLVAKLGATNDDHVILVLRSGIGYRGGNRHTGDRNGWKCINSGGHGRCSGAGTGLELPFRCNKCGGESHALGGPELMYKKLPGTVLTSGSIAQGDAGRMGTGEQLIMIMTKGVVLRTAYTGRLYGKPSEHYHVWDGKRIISVTWEERLLTDVFDAAVQDAAAAPWNIALRMPNIVPHEFRGVMPSE